MSTALSTSPGPSSSVHNARSSFSLSHDINISTHFRSSYRYGAAASKINPATRTSTTTLASQERAPATSTASAESSRMVTASNVRIGMRVRPGRHWRSRKSFHSSRRRSADFTPKIIPGSRSGKDPAAAPAQEAQEEHAPSAPAPEQHADDSWYADQLAAGSATGKILSFERDVGGGRGGGGGGAGGPGDGAPGPGGGFAGVVGGVAVVEWQYSSWLSSCKDVFAGYRIGRDGRFDLARWEDEAVMGRVGASADVGVLGD